MLYSDKKDGNKRKNCGNLSLGSDTGSIVIKMSAKKEKSVKFYH